MAVQLNKVFLTLLFVNLLIVSIGLSTLIYLVSQTYRNSSEIATQTLQIDNLAIRIHNDTDILLNKILTGFSNQTGAQK